MTSSLEKVFEFQEKLGFSRCYPEKGV